MAAPLQVPLDLIRADYNIYRYTDEVYKVVKFRSVAPRLGIVHDRDKHYDHKLDASLSRAKRVVLELALCNEWMFFCTFTINKSKFDRTDLDAWYKSFNQFIRDTRKKSGLDIRYVLVPEKHADGSWHMHGMFSDISPLLSSFADLLAAGANVPLHLATSGYFNWLDYQRKFGFCSFGLIRNSVACAFYVTKYVSKSLSESVSQVGRHLYYASQGLNRAQFHGDVYGNCEYLNSFLRNHYDFCSTGMTALKDGVSWDFALEYMDYELMVPLDQAVEEPEVDRFFEYSQLGFDYYGFET